MSRCTYHGANTRCVVLFEHEKTILHAILTDRAPLLKRIITRLVGFDCAYPAHQQGHIRELRERKASGALRPLCHLRADVFW
jgi:hypothetical protein